MYGTYHMAASTSPRGLQPGKGTILSSLTFCPLRFSRVEKDHCHSDLPCIYICSTHSKGKGRRRGYPSDPPASNNYISDVNTRGSIEDPSHRCQKNPRRTISKLKSRDFVRIHIKEHFEQPPTRTASLNGVPTS
jgi:hypothetical protein